MHCMNLPDAPIANEGFFATHFFTVKDQAQSADFYVRILGGTLIRAANPCYIKLANSWIILNCGGGPTPDKPEVILETPTDLNRVSTFLNLRVADIWASRSTDRANNRALVDKRNAASRRYDSIEREQIIEMHELDPILEDLCGAPEGHSRSRLMFRNLDGGEHRAVHSLEGH